MKYTKLRKEVIDETDCLLEAAVLSFIMDGAEIQRSKTPIISYAFIGKSLNLSEEDVAWAVGELRESGWFVDEETEYEAPDGTDRQSVVWKLSEKALEKVNIRKTKPVGVYDSGSTNNCGYESFAM